MRGKEEVSRGVKEVVIMFKVFEEETIDIHPNSCAVHVVMSTVTHSQMPSLSSSAKPAPWPLKP